MKEELKDVLSEGSNRVSKRFITSILYIALASQIAIGTFSIKYFLHDHMDKFADISIRVEELEDWKTKHRLLHAKGDHTHGE